MNMNKNVYTPSQQKAARMLSTGENVLITGKPGAGKTKIVDDYCKTECARGKKVLATASTGLAASNLENGKTLHSVLRWKPNKKTYDYNECIALLKESDILVIDEVSMLNSSILKHLVECLKRIDYKIQIIMSGDFFQLPPVSKSNIISYPFETTYWKDLKLQSCVLKEVVRQQNQEFLDNLHLLMIGNDKCLEYFTNKSNGNMIEKAIVLSTTNSYANTINTYHMDRLPGKQRTYMAKGDVFKANFMTSRVLNELRIKENMRVMAIRNDTLGRYQNGNMGTVIDMSDDTITVLFDNKNIVDIQRYSFEIEHKNITKGTVNIEQFPLRGGYAITIHKSQGQTYDAINLMASGCWLPGQLYVALSRVREVENIHLLKPLQKKDLKTDIKVINFYEKIMSVA